MLAIEDAGNAAIKFNAETNERQIDGSYISARRTAMLSSIPKGITLDGHTTFTVQGDGDTTVADLVGEYTQTPDGRYVFVHGPLVRAMREGRTIRPEPAHTGPAAVTRELSARGGPRPPHVP